MASTSVKIAVFDNPSFVDTSNNSAAESDNIQASLTSLGHSVSTFTSTVASGIQLAIADKNVLLIPEQERGSLIGALDTQSREVIKDFVNEGGTLIINGSGSSGASLLNGIFGFSTTERYSWSTFSKTTASLGTEFADDPDRISANDATFVLSNLPAGSSNIYTDGSGGAAVASIPYGSGEIVFLGWDWFGAAPVGWQDNGWLPVLNSGVLESSAAVNNAPTLTGTQTTFVAGTEDTVYTISQTELLKGFTDVNGDTLSVSSLTASNGSLVNNNNGTWSFTPAANYNGSINLNYNVTDGKGGSIAATQSFTLAAVNDAAALTGTKATLSAGSEDTIYTISQTDLLAGFTDVDGDTLSVSKLTASNGSLVNNNNGTWSFTPAADYNGSVNLNYNVTDGKGGSTEASQSFTLAAVNDAPTGSATASLVAGTEDTAYTISKEQLLAGFSDVDGNALSITDFATSNGSFVKNQDGSFTITGADNYNGSVTVNYKVSDGSLSVDASNSFNLAAVNDAATLTGTKATLATGSEDTVYTISQTELLKGFTDVDGDKLSVSKLTASNGSLVDNNDGTWSFTPTANYNGSVNLNYNVTDGKGGSTEASQSFSLAAVNDAATLTGTKATLATGSEDTVYTISQTELLAGFTDVDGDILSVSKLTASNGSLVDNNDGTWSFTPTANYNGSVNLNYNVTDGNGGSTEATQSFNLAAVNDAATLTGTKATLATGSEDTVYTISQTELLAGFTDVDGDILSVSKLTASNGSLVDNNNGTWSFTPAANYNGSVNLNYNVTDGNGGSTEAAQSFSLAAVNDAATLTGTKATLATGSEDTVYTISQTELLAGFTDVEGDSLSVSNLTASNGSLVNNNNGTWSFTPTANYNGAVNLSYNVTDGNGGSTEATQSFTLAAVNDAPTLTGTKATLSGGTQGTAYTISQTELLAGFTDVDGDILSVSNLTASNGSLVNNNNGTWSFTPATNYNGAVNLSYNVTDGNGGSTSAAQSFTLGTIQNGGNGKDTLTGNAGNDYLYGGNGQDELYGGAGKDTLIGDNGTDLLIGGDGNDWLIGGNGSDTLTGGNGSDIFVMGKNTAIDTITDFSLGQGDKIGLDGLTFNDLSFSGNEIRNGSNTLAIVTGFDTQTLTQSNFVTL